MRRGAGAGRRVARGKDRRQPPGRLLGAPRRGPHRAGPGDRGRLPPVMANPDVAGYSRWGMAERDPEGGMAAPELSVVCKNCGAEVSPYVTECPYCGTRLRKRAPKLEREGDEF